MFLCRKEEKSVNPLPDFNTVVDSYRHIIQTQNRKHYLHLSRRSHNPVT